MILVLIKEIMKTIKIKELQIISYNVIIRLLYFKFIKLNII